MTYCGSGNRSFKIPHFLRRIVHYVNCRDHQPRFLFSLFPLCALPLRFFAFSARFPIRCPGLSPLLPLTTFSYFRRSSASESFSPSAPDPTFSLICKDSFHVSATALLKPPNDLLPTMSAPAPYMSVIVAICGAIQSSSSSSSIASPSSASLPPPLFPAAASHSICSLSALALASASAASFRLAASAASALRFMKRIPIVAPDRPVFATFLFTAEEDPLPPPPLPPPPLPAPPPRLPAGDLERGGVFVRECCGRPAEAEGAAVPGFHIFGDCS
mmetsp:Transcript_26685/g.78836  ORF Transcript_26685/g.78836 Transcript_26685/m.78836 type:complete len:273 (-) Transcript_26685:83-901(-)